MESIYEQIVQLAMAPTGDNVRQFKEKHVITNDFFYITNDLTYSISWHFNRWLLETIGIEKCGPEFEVIRRWIDVNVNGSKKCRCGTWKIREVKYVFD